MREENDHIAATEIIKADVILVETDIL